MTLIESSITRQRKEGLSPPPALRGYTLRATEALNARDSNRLLTIWIEASAGCNLRCAYCDAGQGGRQEADIALLKDLVAQAARAGCASVCFSPLRGDPLLYSNLPELVETVDSLGMVPVVPTNGLLLTAALAEFLYRRNATVLVKCDSFDAATQDRLAGMEGAYAAMREGLGRLIDAGFMSGPAVRLGASFAANRLNAREAEDFWRFCRANRFFPDLRIVSPGTRAGDIGLSPGEAARMKLMLREIDREEYGYDWDPGSPVPGGECMMYFAGMYVTLEGDARPCACTPLERHPGFQKDGEYPLNVRRKSLTEIYHSGPMYYCRHIDSFIEGKCRESGSFGQCIGCRGSAYSAGISSGMGPLQALASQCGRCSR